MKIAVAAALCVLAFAGAIVAVRAAELTELTGPQSDYVEHCSGCHGMGGNSYPADIPVLRDRVGYFLCTQEGREYLIRLPNVAYSAIGDDQQLADMMNFVVFGLGGHSVPKGAKQFTAAEIGTLRKRPLATTSLIDTRARIVGNMVRTCGAPKSMNRFYDPALLPKMNY